MSSTLQAGSRTPVIPARVPGELITAARKAHPELNEAGVSLLIRVALAVLAGYSVKTALESMKRENKPGGAIGSLPDLNKP